MLTPDPRTQIPSISYIDALDDLCVLVGTELGLSRAVIGRIVHGNGPKFAMLMTSYELIQLPVRPCVACAVNAS